jgi:phosphoglycerate dehydrogenase-like enzyme
VVLTPHIGGTTSAAFRAMGVGAAEHILGVLAGPQATSRHPVGLAKRLSAA